jgi:xanthine dehydrogenase YagT iron-sulfur-binding subunit
VTLLDALRTRADLTGNKRVCDRGTCGACTMIVDGRTVYACSTLAIEVQGKAVRTVEGLATGGALHPVQQAFCDVDALMCGFCTPGFVVATVAVLEKYPNATREQRDAPAPRRGRILAAFRRTGTPWPRTCHRR